MYEVQVFSSGVNVAVNGSAIQSSDYGLDYIASNAIDNNGSSYSLTMDDDPYWEVDLGGPFSIESVVIVNSFTDPHGRMLVDGSYSGLDSINIDDSSCRLTNAVVSMLDVDGFAIASQSVGNTCSQSTVTAAFNSSTTFSRVSDQEGWCVDSHGYYYSYVKQETAPSSTASECGIWCLQYPSSLIGFDYHIDRSNEVNECHCLFNNDVPGVIGTYDPQYDELSLGEMGVGPITSVSGDSDWFCYRNNVSCSIELESFCEQT